MARSSRGPGRNPVLCGTLVAGASLLALALMPAVASPAVSTASDVPSPERVDQILRDSGEILWTFTDTYFHGGDYAQVIRLDHLQAELSPQNLDAFSTGAWLAWSSGDPELAIRDLKQEIAKNPDTYQSYSDLGDCYWIWLKQPDKAMPYYIRASSFFPDPPWNVYGSLAHVAENLGELDRAEVAWRMAKLKLAPGDASIAVVDHNLGRVLDKERPLLERPGMDTGPAIHQN